MEDLTPGLILKGTVRNVADFGACRYWSSPRWPSSQSQMANRFIKHPLEVVKVRCCWCKNIEVDVKRKRISLSMKELSNVECTFYIVH